MDQWCDGQVSESRIPGQDVAVLLYASESRIPGHSAMMLLSAFSVLLQRWNPATFTSQLSCNCILWPRETTQIIQCQLKMLLLCLQPLN